MNLGFYPIASSSKGNCYLIKSEDTNILLDAGVSGKKIEEALNNINLSLKKIDGLLLTHEHVDHMQSANKIICEAKESILYCSKGTKEAAAPKLKSMTDDRVNLVSEGDTFLVGDIEVTAFGLSHDASQPLGFSFKKNDKKITIVTDTGKLTEEIDMALIDSDILVIESNHEVNILLYGRYPYHVKHRILSDEGHLSNELCGEGICRFLKNKSEDKIPYVFLAHLSKENNTPQQAVLTVSNILEENDFYVGKNLRLRVLPPEADNEYIVI